MYTFRWEGLHIHGAHVGVPVSPESTGSCHRINASEIVGTQIDVNCGAVLFEPGAMPSPRYGNDILAPMKHPRERKLRGGDFLLARDVLEQLHRFNVASEILFIKAWLPSQ